MRPYGNAQELERRRRRAVGLLENGYGFHEVAQRTAMHPQSVRRLWRHYQAHGEAALAAKRTNKSPSKLSDQQKADLTERLAQGARAEGFATDMWNSRRVQQVIEKHYGVHYHVEYLPRLLRELGFSPSEA
jgi:putative transposase